MFKQIWHGETPTSGESPKEGELYKTVTTFGRTFELRYGYYEECDRQNPLCQPIPIYPDFRREPLYTEEGSPFVTVMQDVCEHVEVHTSVTADSTCDECAYFKQGEEWFGICTHPKNKRANE